MNTPELIVLGSSSAGNGYIIECSQESLVIELGLDFASYNRNFSKIAGCIVSHEHHDHLRKTTAEKFIRLGVPVFGNEAVCEAVQGANMVEPAHKYRIGEKFLVQPISVPHNVPALAYVIDHPETGRIVFATDLSSFNYSIPNVSHWIIEANYSEDFVLDKGLSGEEINQSTFNHLSFENCLEALEANSCASLRTVTLIHLSDSNSNAGVFKDTASRNLCLDNVFIADKGVTVPLKNTDF